MEKQKQLVLTTHLMAALVFCLIEGQHTKANVTLEEVFFSSPGYIDDLDYGINMTRDYRFHTNYPGHTLLLRVVEFVLEPADKNGDCLYDKVLIYDGYNRSSERLEELCGTIPPGTTYTTSGDTAYVVFTSDGSFNFKGFQFSIVSDGPVITTTTEKPSTELPTTTKRPTTVRSTTLPVSSRTTSIIVSTTTDAIGSSTTSQTSTDSPTSISSATPTSIQTRGTSDISTVPTSITKPTSTSSTSLLVSTRTTSTMVPTTTSQTLTESPTSIISATSISTSTRDSIDTSTISMSTIKPTTTISTKSPVSTRTTSARIPTKTDSSDLSTTSQTSTVPSTSISSVSSTSTVTHVSIDTSTTVTTYPETTARNTTEDDTPKNDYTIWVIVGCCAVGFILFVISGVVLYRYLKKKENTVKTVYPLPCVFSHDTVGKTAFRNEAPVFENGTTKPTNIFDMDLPSPKYKANTLPPLSDGFSVETV